MRFDRASSVEEIVWQMRLADKTRSEDRRVILRQFNGNPPFDDATAEENGVQININDLSGPNLLSMARRQWNNAFLKPSYFFIAKPDSGPGHKRSTWGNIFTRHANRLLKRNRRMVGQIRATGAQTLLHGVGPVTWKDRRGVVPSPIPMGSLMIPSETEIDDWDNLEYFAIFREWTPAMLWEMTHGSKADAVGWNMDLVRAQMDYLKNQMYKSPTSLAYQFMPERIEELIKQDKGYFGTDAVPTCDVWDFYFREAEDGKGWYRRIILDWNTGSDISAYKDSSNRPESRNKVGEDTTFLYTSGKRKYANSVSEMLHCQFGDCSAYAPFKYHSIRSLGWMLWGVCDLQNRLHCKFNEGVFEQLMWFFQTAGNQDLVRLKKANFEHMGVIPQGIKFLTAAERFTPNHQLIGMAFDRNRQLMADSATTYTQSYEKSNEGQGRTATETMAIVNATNALASGILEMAYTYETFKYREMCRRLCIKNSPDPIAREFRLNCLKDGIPEDMLDVEKWSIECEQVLGGGNKTLQMATVGFLNTIRKNIPPAGQRIIDHISVEAATDQPDLAEEIAPVGEDQPISNSKHNAELATQRILAGFEYQEPKDAVMLDYIDVWLGDLATEIQKALKQGGVVSPDQLNGLLNLGGHIQKFLQELGESAIDQDDKENLKEYEQAFSVLSNHVKGLAQRLQEAMKKSAQGNGDQGAAGPDPKDAAKVEAMLIQAKTKAAIAERSAAARTRQKEEQFQKAEVRKDQELAANLQRDGITTRHELMADRLRVLQSDMPDEAKD